MLSFAASIHASRVIAINHSESSLSLASRTEITLYLGTELPLLKLEDGPFEFDCELTDGSIIRYFFPFKGHLTDSRIIYIAVEDKDYAVNSNLDYYLMAIQQQMRLAGKEDVLLMTQRGLND
ncbi:MULTISPECIES: hypothetical protein [Methylobacterium]|uniref:hypothetical protein n=1 Tax=Methylobacterium TaxID=407 RepID=UPI0013EB5520|nr:hypothetical protein [Methylobacterium sp. DB0501]NGM38267.1 hypothetical protein [Methylobacterium sp. DB0501]